MCRLNEIYNQELRSALGVHQGGRQLLLLHLSPLRWEVWPGVHRETGPAPRNSIQRLCQLQVQEIFTRYPGHDNRVVSECLNGSTVQTEWWTEMLDGLMLGWIRELLLNNQLKINSSIHLNNISDVYLMISYVQLVTRVRCLCWCGHSRSGSILCHETLCWTCSSFNMFNSTESDSKQSSHYI